MWLAASSFDVPHGVLATLANAQLNPKPHQGVSTKNPASHPALDERNSTVAIGLRAGLLLNRLRQSERARYYGSALGRFTSPDFGGPIPNQPDPVPWADLANPQSLNLYAYGLNNPLANVDDDGHDVNVCLNDENGNQHCTQMTNEQYAAASQGNAGTKAPTLNQVGMNGDGNGNFNATDITDSNGNNIGTATYVSNGGADYYANRNGIDMLARNARTMNDPRTYALWLGASATAGYGLYAAGATSGELTLLGDITLTPTAGETSYAQRLLAQGGKKGVEKAIRTLSKRLAEHQAKVGNLAGDPGSVQREIAGFTRTIEALKPVLR